MTIAELQKMTKGLPSEAEVYFGVSDTMDEFFNLNRVAVEFANADADSQNFIIYLDRLES